FSSRRRHTRCLSDWSSDVCSSDLETGADSGLYDGRMTALLILDDLRVGDVLDYAITVHGENPVFNGRFMDSWNMQSYSPIERMRSEERRVGKEGRYAGWAERENRK